MSENTPYEIEMIERTTVALEMIVEQLARLNENLCALLGDRK